MGARIVGTGLLVSALLCVLGDVSQAQFDDSQQQLPQPIPPPRPPEPKPDLEDVPEYESVVEESDAPWGLDEELLVSLREKAAVYQEYTNRFTCDETARLATYRPDGDVSDEKVRHYAYLLLRDPLGRSVRESRRIIARDGRLKPGLVEDEEPFPPAYEWVFLFSDFYEPFFSFRLTQTGFEGFDLAHEIQFRGSLSFTDGKDIRQWEGRVLIDAFTRTPIEIHAEPTGQRDRIDLMYRDWAKSFNLLGYRTRRPPLAYEAQIQFRYRRDELTFPTELRYDTKKAISPTQLVAVRASTRAYRKYLIQKVQDRIEIGEPLEP